MEQFTNLFQVHRTVKFELRPEGKTEGLINQNGFLLSDDKERAMAYQVVKCLIDDYYQKEVIAPLLKKVTDNKDWNRQLAAYGDATDSNTRRTTSKNLATIIIKAKPNELSANSLYTQLHEYLQKQNTEDLRRILKDLQYDEIAINNRTLKAAWNTNLKDFVQDAIDKFKGFTLYFKTLAVNMKQLFSGKKNGLAHRIIYQNLYTFIRNKSALDDLKVVINEFSNEKEIAVTDFSDCLLQDGIDKYNKRIGQLVQRLKEYCDSHPKSSKWHRRFKQLNKQILSPRIAPDWLPAAFTNDEMMVVAICAFIKSMNPQFSALKEFINQIDTYNGPIFIYRKSLRSIAVQMFGDYKSLDDAFDIPRGYSQSESLSLQWTTPEVRQKFFGLLKENLSATLLSIQKAYTEAEEFLSLKRAESNDYRRNNNASVSINKLMDAYKHLYYLLRPLTGTGEETERDEDFYGSFMPIIDVLQPINKLFESVRNWLTKKAYRNDSYPAYLGMATILNNWSNRAVYLKKDGKYYFCLASTKSEGKRDIHDILKQLWVSNSPKDAVIFLTSTQSPERIKANLPRIFIRSKEAGEVNSFVEKHSELKTEWEKLKGGDYESPELKNEAINYFQKCLQLHDSYKNYKYHFRPATEYEDYNSFANSLTEETLFYFEEKPICWNELLQFVEDEKVYLFQLYNKDYADSRPSNSSPNLHTLYWEAVFSQQNRISYDLKLEEPKLYFREKADIVQRTGDIRSVPLRYQEPKMHLHIPILMNANAPKTGDINQQVLEQIKTGTFTHIIGIDRGERNLLYYSVLDMNGNIVEQKGLNIINDVDYHKLLLEKEEDLDDEQKKWKVRSGIRKLKEGYLSHAIHQLTNLIHKYNAILVIEDLDEAFKHSRQKIDMQIYQLFEKMLIEKLSYLVDKNVNDGNHVGSTFRALQLATPGLKQQEKGIKQNGILFFVPPEYTSTIDPVTGFCNLFDRNHVKNIKLLFTNFKRISYNTNHDWFEFEWDYRDVLQYTRLKECANPQPWVVCSMGERIEWTGSKHYKNQKCESVDLTTEFKTLFERYNIQYGNGVDLKDAIASINKKEDINELKRLFFLTVSLRNKPDKDTDYILSPVRDANGVFFDSREDNKKNHPKLPVDGDANGAYNIGRKGILSINKLKNGTNEPLSLEEWVQSVR